MVQTVKHDARGRQSRYLLGVAGHEGVAAPRVFQTNPSILGMLSGAGVRVQKNWVFTSPNECGGHGSTAYDAPGWRLSREEDGFEGSPGLP